MLGTSEFCGGPGVIRLLNGEVVIAEEPFCPLTNSRPDGVSRLLGVIVRRRHICNEAVYDATQNNSGPVVLTAELSDAEPTTLVLYQTR